MARTPDPSTPKGKVTAFLVTPDMPGFEVLEARMPKCGIRGTATGKIRFTNMRVPKENVLGQVGRGLKLALTVLDYGRITFGATCTGHAKACIRAMIEHARHRIQFQQPLAEFQLVQKKIAYAAAHCFAMEAMTNECAAFIDRGAEDYMLETAMLKVFATEHLWTIVNDTLQVWGGKGYFSDQPIERWMRDARINLIGEGANEVLKAFIAVVGCRGPGMYLKGLQEEMFSGVRGFFRRLPAALGVGARLFVPWLAGSRPSVPVRSPQLQAEARQLASLVRDFALELPHVFLALKDETTFAQAQLIHERIADMAIDLYAAACTLARLDHLLQQTTTNGAPTATDPYADIPSGRYFLQLAFRRIRERLAALRDNDDPALLACARSMIPKFG
jgi:uncharacterized protein (DUF433 family)